MGNKKFFATLFLALFCFASSWAQKSIVWEKPQTAFSRLSTRFNIKKVELCDTATVLTFHFQFAGGQQVGFSNETMLQADGKDYKIKSIKDYNLNAPITMPQSGELDIDLVFTPLPKDVKSFNFNMPGAFAINDIRDRNRMKDGITDTYWRNDNTGDWMLGVSKNHLVYDSKVWSITSQTEKKGAYTINAQNGGDAIAINISKAKGKNRTITIGTEKTVCSLITSDYLPDYPVKDTTSKLADNGYRSGDSITIIAWLKDMPQDMRNISGEFEAAFESIFTGSNKVYSIKLDSLGCFTLRMPIENSQMLYCDWNRSSIMFIAEPGETYFLLKDFYENKTLVMGRNARLQNEWLGNTISYENGNYQKLPEIGGAMPYLAQCDNFKNEALANLDAMCKEHPTISTRTLNLRREEMLSSIGNSAMEGQFMVKEFTLPQEFIDQVTANYWNKIEVPYTALGNNYTAFIRNYSDQLLSHLPEEDEMPAIYALKRAHKEGKLQLSDDDLLVINSHPVAFHAFKEKMEATPDSLKQDVIDEFNNSKVVTETNAICAREGVLEAAISYFQLYDYERLLAKAESLGWNKTLKDIVITTKLCNLIDHDRKPLKPYLLEFADANIHHEAAKQAIHEINDKYETLGKKTLSADNLKSNDDVKDLTEGEQILNKILEPYRGKLVLLDIWGTWCGPCKLALAESQKEYERLKDYPIVYLYLADRSPEENWKNVIKEYNITGENVVHYNLPEDQQKAVENYLMVRGFPTYKLFDQQGNLLDLNADPRDLDSFEDLLKRILGK